MKLKAYLVTVLFFAFAAGAVFAQDVRYNFDRNTDFSKFKTYKWVQVKDADQLNDMADRQLKQTVDAELATKGLQKSESEDADLYIAYEAAISQEKQFISYSTDWGYGPGWGGRWYGGPSSSTTYGSTSTVQVGQIDLSMYDRAAKAMVWRSSATKTLDTKAKPDKQEKNLKKAVAKMLKNYPPSSK